MAATWKTIRVFISSTFRDMHAERDHLIKVTFPALREKLLPHRVELYDIDLRWGITEDEAKNEKVIGLCLDQVDECRPFFLAFLGHRYGWVPAQVPQETRQRFPFMQQFPGVSVTELELRHGAMLDPAATHALVLLRGEEAVQSIPKCAREKDFIETDPKLQQQLDSLKQELEAGPYSVQPYSAVWNPQRYDRVNRTDGRLDGLEYFGVLVEEWLWEAIRTQLQLPDTPAAVEPLDVEADLHERFLELRTRIYIGRDDLYQRLRTFALANGATPLLLTGESGLGKSATLARFVDKFREEHRGNPNVFVLPHFVGASPRTTSLPGMLQRLTQELQRQFSLTLPKAESPDEIIRTFVVALTSVPQAQRVVLVFDALNQLDADSRAETLIWLPKTLPPNVRVLCSAATSPRKPPRVLSAFGERAFVDVPMLPLTTDERREIVKAVPKLVAKSLDDRQIDALLANPATRNPLFLMVALEELRGYGSFERLNQMIAGLPRDGDTVARLFEQVFERLEQEFNKPLVESILRLLACSRRGLSGRELVQLTQTLGDEADDLYPVLRQLRPYLQVRDGLFDFYHLSIRRAVEVRYLKWEDEEDQHDPWARWNPQRPTPASAPSAPEQETRQRLIDCFRTHKSPHSLDELPWQLSQLRDWKGLFDLLGDLSFFDSAWYTNELEVRAAWGLVKAAGGLEPIDAYRAVLANPADHDPGLLWRLAAFLGAAGQGQSTLPLWTFFIEHFRRTGDGVMLASSLRNHARILNATGNVKEALQQFQEAEAICRRCNDAAGLADCLGGEAGFLNDTGDIDGAVRLLQEVEAAARRLNDPARLATTLANHGIVLFQAGDLDGAMRLSREAEAIYRRLNDPTGLSHCLVHQAQILRDTGDLDGAMRRYKEVEAINRRLNDPSQIAHSLLGQATLLINTGDYAEAARLHKEAEALYRQLNDPDGLSHSLDARANLMNLTGDSEGAWRLLKEQEALWRGLNKPGGLASCLGHQALMLGTSNPDEAMRLHQEEEAIYRRLDNPARLATCLGNQALLLRDKGDLKGAMRLLKEQEAMCRKLDDPLGLAGCLGQQGGILMYSGELTEAMRLHKEEEALARRLNNPGRVSRSLIGQARIREANGDWHGALRLEQEVAANWRRLGNHSGLAISLAHQVSLLKSTGDLNGALAMLQEEEPLRRQLDDMGRLADNLVQQAMTLKDMRDQKAALRVLKEHEALCRQHDQQRPLSGCLGHQAWILQEAGDLAGAIRLLKEQEAITRRLNDPAGLQNSLGNQALILMDNGDLDGALRLFKEQEAICRRLKDPDGLARSLINQGTLLAFNRSRPAKGLPLAEEALRLARQHDLLALAGQFEPIVDQIRRLLK